MMKFLVIVGVSGTGKTELEKRLVTNYPSVFAKTNQVTTRDKRNETDNGYAFIDNNSYDILEPNLIGKTEVNGKRYGSILPSFENRINTIILNEAGLDDFVDVLDDLDQKAGTTLSDFLVLGLDTDDLDYQTSLPGREGRDVRKERKVLKDVEKLIKVDIKQEDYASDQEVIDWCMKYFFVNKK